MFSRRDFAVSAVGCAVAGASLFRDQDENDAVQDKAQPTPRESEFRRDYEPPKFQPKWENPIVNRVMVQDFVIFAHSDLEMVKKLYDKNPLLLNGAMDWGKGDWETALGGASHMGRKDIVKFLLSKGARIDIFCATMMGMLGTVKEILKLEPALANAKGPHGFSLEHHAKMGKGDAKDVLEFLQSLKD